MNCCKNGRYICYFCNSRVCKEHSQVYKKFRSWRAKIKPRICNSCTTQMALHKWLDKVQYRADLTRKHMERYRGDPQYRETVKQIMLNYARKNRKELSIKTMKYQKDRIAIDPQYKRRIRDAQIRYWRKRYHTDPEFRQKQLERSRRRYKENSEKIREKRRASYYRKKDLNTH